MAILRDCFTRNYEAFCLHFRKILPNLERSYKDQWTSKILLIGTLTDCLEMSSPMIILYRSDKPGTPGEISLKEERDDQNFSQDLLLNDQEMDQLDDDVQELMGAIAEAFLPKMNLSV